MKIECKLDEIAYEFAHKCTKFQFSCYGDITSNLESYTGKKVVLELKNEKRSLNANGYLWVLLGELQEKLKIPKEEIYREYIRGCGSYDVYCMKDDALDSFIKYWTSLGLGWVVDTAESKLKGCTNVLAYKGTSEYTKEEMSVLLGQVVNDCQDQGIPTKKKEDIDNLLESWE